MSTATGAPEPAGVGDASSGQGGPNPAGVGDASSGQGGPHAAGIGRVASEHRPPATRVGATQAVAGAPGRKDAA